MASRRRSLRTVGPVERLRSICLALPETAEKVAWGVFIVVLVYLVTQAPLPLLFAKFMVRH